MAAEEEDLTLNPLLCPPPPGQSSVVDLVNHLWLTWTTSRVSFIHWGHAPSRPFLL